MTENIKVGDWITIWLKDGSVETGNVIELEKDTIVMYDGNEGWNVELWEVEKIEKEL